MTHRALLVTTSGMESIALGVRQGLQGVAVTQLNLGNNKPPISEPEMFTPVPHVVVIFIDGGPAGRLALRSFEGAVKSLHFRPRYGIVVHSAAFQSASKHSAFLLADFVLSSKADDADVAREAVGRIKRALAAYDAEVAASEYRTSHAATAVAGNYR